MRPRGKTQDRYNEAIQILSGTRVKNHSLSNNSIDSMANTGSENSSIDSTANTTRRAGCPQTILHIWDAIAYIRQQRQVSNFERLSVYMKRMYDLSEQNFKRELKLAVQDELIILRQKLGCKGSKRGVQQEGYLIPEAIKTNDGHDWYCFECHIGGEVMLCSTCHRVYHESCAPDHTAVSPFICPVCKDNLGRFEVKLKKAEINTVLGFTCIRLKEKTKELHRIPGSYTSDDEKWRFDFLIYKPMDLNVMEDKMKCNEYTRLGEFFNDAQQIVHNIIVYFGANSHIASLAKQMIFDCEYDLIEIIQCTDCYKMSNTKNDPDWFCQPCNPPHDLVYAKIKGYPYWPAKVVRKLDNLYDVRFFGVFHQRALVDQNYVKPISVNYASLGTKMTASFKRAYKELQQHMKLLAKPNAKVDNKTPTEENNNESQQTQDAYRNPKSKGVSRKRKSVPSSVPIKKNKKFFTESPTSSSQTNVVSTEDHNLVSSSCQDTSVSHVSIGIQTEKESSCKDDSKTQKDSRKSCDCSAKYEKQLQEQRRQLNEEHKTDKKKALQQLSDKLHAELEQERQKTLSKDLEKLQLEQKDAQHKAENQTKEAFEQQINKLIEQQKLELSETKRKQWCYNCENEAIYHCCWNTSYCSVDCQQAHWHKEHKRTCRRKR